MKWLRRMRQNIIWIGGWEVGNGWSFRASWGWRSPTPVTICRFLTFYGWGIDCRLPWTILVCSWRGDRGIYLSKDGTPNCARWIRIPRWRRG